MSSNDIRRFLQIVEGVELTEAQDYNSMFNDIRKLVAVYKDDHLADIINETISGIIPLAKQNLKKNDRVVWFLRLYKQLLINDMRTFINDKSRSILSQKERDAFMKPVDDFQERYKQDINAKGGDKAWSSSLTDGMNFIGSAVMPSDSGKIRNLLEKFAHYFSLPIPEIQNVVFQYQPMAAVMNTFRGLEVEWQKKAKETFQHDPEEGQAIIKFPDGFVWWLLWTGSCSREGKAMGHCGNVPSERPGDRLLSLRKMSKVGNVEMSRPSLTFILHKDGYLGEMKGRANEKPNAKYHPYIIELLKNDIIKGIRGGGYAPENNFSMNDLDNNIRDELVDMKPELGTVFDLYKREGATERVIQKMQDEYGVPLKGKVFNRGEETYGVLDIYKDAFDYAERNDEGRRNNALDYVIKILNGDTYYDQDSVDPTDSDKENLLDGLKPYVRKEVGEYLAKNYLGEYMAKNYPEHAEDFDDYNPESTSDIIQLQDIVNDDELDTAFRNAVTSGFQLGAESAMSNQFWKEITKNPYLLKENGDFIDGPYFNKVYVAAPISEIIEKIEEDREAWDYDDTWLNMPDNERYKVDIEYPNYGWDEYDDEAAQESFRDMLVDGGITKTK